MFQICYLTSALINFTPRVDRVRVKGVLFSKHDMVQYSSTGQLVERLRVRLWKKRSDFKSWAGKIGHIAMNGSPPLRHFFGRSVLSGRSDMKMGPANSLHALV